jgi:hypothetical protein
LLSLKLRVRLGGYLLSVGSLLPGAELSHGASCGLSGLLSHGEPTEVVADAFGLLGSAELPASLLPLLEIPGGIELLHEGLVLLVLEECSAARLPLEAANLPVVDAALLIEHAFLVSESAALASSIFHAVLLGVNLLLLSAHAFSAGKTFLLLPELTHEAALPPSVVPLLAGEVPGAADKEARLAAGVTTDNPLVESSLAESVTLGLTVSSLLGPRLFVNVPLILLH